MSAMEVMWFREYIHSKESINKDDSEALREKKIEKSLERVERLRKLPH